MTFLYSLKFPSLDKTESTAWFRSSLALRSDRVRLNVNKHTALEKCSVRHLADFIQLADKILNRNTQNWPHNPSKRSSHTVFLWRLKLFLVLCGCGIIHSLYELWFFPRKVRKTIKKTLLRKVSRGYTTNKSLCCKWTNLSSPAKQNRQQRGQIQLNFRWEKCQLVKNLSQKKYNTDRIRLCSE